MTLHAVMGDGAEDGVVKEDLQAGGDDICHIDLYDHYDEAILNCLDDNSLVGTSDPPKTNDGGENGLPLPQDLPPANPGVDQGGEAAPHTSGPESLETSWDDALYFGHHQAHPAAMGLMNVGVGTWYTLFPDYAGGEHDPLALQPTLPEVSQPSPAASPQPAASQAATARNRATAKRATNSKAWTLQQSIEICKALKEMDAQTHKKRSFKAIYDELRDRYPEWMDQLFKPGHKAGAAADKAGPANFRHRVRHLLGDRAVNPDMRNKIFTKISSPHDMREMLRENFFLSAEEAAAPDLDPLVDCLWEKKKANDEKSKKAKFEIFYEWPAPAREAFASLLVATHKRDSTERAVENAKWIQTEMEVKLAILTHCTCESCAAWGLNFVQGESTGDLVARYTRKHYELYHGLLVGHRDNEPLNRLTRDFPVLKYLCETEVDAIVANLHSAEACDCCHAASRVRRTRQNTVDEDEFDSFDEDDDDDVDEEEDAVREDLAFMLRPSKPWDEIEIDLSEDDEDEVDDAAEFFANISLA